MRLLASRFSGLLNSWRPLSGLSLICAEVCRPLQTHYIDGIGTSREEQRTKTYSVPSNFDCEHLCNSSLTSWHLVDLILPALPVFLESASIVTDTCWNELCYWGERTRCKTAMGLDVETLFALIDCKDHRIKIPAVRIFWNIIAGYDSQAQCLLNSGLIEHLGDLMFSSDKEIQMEALCCFESIAAWSEEQVCPSMHSFIGKILIISCEIAYKETNYDAYFPLFSSFMGKILL